MSCAALARGRYRASRVSEQTTFAWRPLRLPYAVPSTFTRAYPAGCPQPFPGLARRLPARLAVPENRGLCVVAFGHVCLLPGGLRPELSGVILATVPGGWLIKVAGDTPRGWRWKMAPGRKMMDSLHFTISLYGI